jgi:hypothetical protein
MSSITLDCIPPGLHFPRHHTPASFDSRTPSPDIPIPPNFFVKNTSAYPHNQLRNPTATKIQENDAGPLRKSWRLNVKEEGKNDGQSANTDQNNKASLTIETQLNDNNSPSPALLVEESANKPAVLVDDATLLLNLRTSPAGTCTSHDTLSLDFHGDHHTIATDNSTIATVESSFHKSVESGTPQAQAKPLPVPKNYPRRLALEGDETQLNALHCYIRRSLLEIFVVERKKNVTDMTPSTNSSAGRVGLRCMFCASARQSDPSGKNEAPMAVFYPRTVSEIYRLVTSWQRCHLRKCRNLPPSVRAEWNSVREAEKCRGKTSYWVDSAKQIGLVDCVSKAGGIRFCLPCAIDDADDLSTCVV